MSTSVGPARPTSRAPRAASVVGGALLGALALALLLPLLVSGLTSASEPAWERALGALAFGLPLVLLGLAGVGFVRHGLGRPRAPRARPAGRTGWAAVLLALASLGSLGLFWTTAAFVRESLPTGGFFDLLRLALPVVVAGVLAAASLVAGLVAVVRGDRAASVLAALAYAWFVVSFAGGELLFEH